jgi:GPH family glycoside/pentoside/hexuronide:cation symporter
VVSLIMISAMLSDVIEDSAVKTGRRSEGLFFAANSIVQKCVSGLGVFVSGLLLASVSFPKGADPATIDPAVVTRLVLVYAPTLAVLYGVGMACLLGYRITRAQHTENLKILAARDGASPLTPSPRQPPAPTRRSPPRRCARERPGAWRPRPRSSSRSS